MGQPNCLAGFTMVRGAVRARLLEDAAEVLFALADPHVEDVADADGHERGPDLAGGRAGQVGLAAAGRPVEEHAAAGLLK